MPAFGEAMAYPRPVGRVTHAKATNPYNVLESNLPPKQPTERRSRLPHATSHEDRTKGHNTTSPLCSQS